MQREKCGIIDIAQICETLGVQHAIISPGSRNAPLVSAFTGQNQITCLSIPDERCAAFFALGIAQQTKKPVVLICTSGTAALNYAPAVAEAFYQHVPLVIFTADRAVEWIDQGDGQTIRQQGLFGNHVRASLQLPQEATTADELWHSSRLVCEAIIKSQEPIAGPVHVNVPMQEPLYNMQEIEGSKPKVFMQAKTKLGLERSALNQMQEEWKASSRKMVLVGMMHPNRATDEFLSKLSADPSVVILKESTSNIQNEAYVACIDRTLAAMDGFATYAPDLLITMGGAVVSKRIKEVLRQNQPTRHWNVGQEQILQDTYQALTLQIPVNAEDFLAAIEGFPSAQDSDYQDRWKLASNHGSRKHQDFLSKAPYSDLVVFRELLNRIPSDSQLQLANSTPIRYSQLFDENAHQSYFSNRGASGIDGCSSTAMGAAWASKLPTTLITGDIAFLYDSNAFWHNYIPPNLKVVLINNGGGGIFRFLDGPDKTGHLEEFFETSHNFSGEHVAKMFGLNYKIVANFDELVAALDTFYDQQNSKADLLEIKTPAETSAATLRQYFQHIKSGK